MSKDEKSRKWRVPIERTTVEVVVIEVLATSEQSAIQFAMAMPHGLGDVVMVKEMSRRPAKYAAQVVE